MTSTHRRLQTLVHFIQISKLDFVSSHDTYALIVGVGAASVARASLYTAGISHELCFVSVLYQYLRPPSAVYSFHGWLLRARCSNRQLEFGSTS